MGIRGELFTTQIPVENRTYFFNVKENRLGDIFLQIVESKNTDGAGFDRHAIVVFQDEMQTFLQGLNASLDFLEKRRKEKFKEKRERKQASIHTDLSSTEKRNTIKKRSSNKRTTAKVRIIKKDTSD